MFWRIINNCEPQELLMDLLLQGYHNKRQKIFHLQQSNMERVGKFSFTNRLNDIIPLLSDLSGLNKTKILDIVPAKCDSWIICDADIFFRKIISDLDIFDSLITCDLWHLIFLTFLYQIILSPWYPSIAVLQTFKNDCCACIWDHWINWIELSVILLKALRLYVAVLNVMSPAV